jgi:hypothetical protein
MYGMLYGAATFWYISDNDIRECASRLMYAIPPWVKAASLAVLLACALLNHTTVTVYASMTVRP